MMTDTCGLTSCEPFAKWDHDSQSWKTSEATSLWALTLSSLTLPAWGGLHDGELSEHPTPGLHTSAPDYSSLPTPTVDDASNITRASGCYNSLTRTATSLLPTPAVNDMGEGKTLEWWDDWAPRQKSSDGRPAPHGRSLAIEAQRLLPTPSAADAMGGHLTRSGDRSDELLLPGLVKTFLPTPTSQAAKHGELSPVEREGNRPQDRGNLWVVMPRLAEEATLPTPTSRDWKGANQRGDATCLHGAITAQPSNGGSASSDGQLPGQLSLDGLAHPA